MLRSHPNLEADPGTKAIVANSDHGAYTVVDSWSLHSFAASGTMHMFPHLVQ